MVYDTIVDIEVQKYTKLSKTHPDLSGQDSVM